MHETRPTLTFRVQQLPNGEWATAVKIEGEVPITRDEQLARFSDEELSRGAVGELRIAIGTLTFRCALPQDHPKHLGRALF